jgi:hypothetical protein
MASALEPIGEEIWLVDGPEVSFFGFPYPTRMAVVRLPSRRLWIWSPVELDDDLARAVDALGPVSHLVSPNKIHHLFMGQWQERYPDAALWASPGLSRRRPDLGFRGELGDDPEPAWEEVIDQVILGGSVALDEVLFHHRPSRTTLVCDLIQKHDPETATGLKGWMMRLDDLVGPDGSTPREWRLTFLDRGAARRARARALSWDTEQLVIAHGFWVRRDGREVLRRGLAWLGD